MSNDEFAIRRATPSDAAPLAAFAERMFRETFGADNDPQHLAAHLAATFGPARQQAELESPGIVTLLMQRGGDLAGYAMVQRHAPPPCVADRTSVELWRFYVDRPWHGTGAAAQLMGTVRQVAAELGATSIWLSVWERNPRARAFYRKSGFEDVGAADFWVGGDCQKDRILAAPVAAVPNVGPARLPRRTPT